MKKVTSFLLTEKFYLPIIYMIMASIIYGVIKGRTMKSLWFDEGRIELVGQGISKEEVSGSKPGGCDYVSSVVA